jgi:hypothetical protein
MGYFHVGNKPGGEDFINWELLRQAPVIASREHAKLVRFEKPLTIKIDGQNSRGVILNPEE